LFSFQRIVRSSPKVETFSPLIFPSDSKAEVD